MNKIKNFLYYNWLKIAFCVFILFLVLLTFKQCSDRKEIELGILYAGEVPVSDTLPSLAAEVKEKAHLKDLDGDGIINVIEKAITIPKSKELIMEKQVLEQIQVELISGDSRVYILNEALLKNHSVDENFLDISPYIAKESDTSACLKYADGRIYAVPVWDKPILNKYGIETEGMYVAIRNFLPENADDIKNINAVEALKFILGGK